MDELSYLIVTPYSLNKSRTGGMMARLLFDLVEIACLALFVGAVFLIA